MSLILRAFVLIRHGQTDANRDGVIAGRTEAQLTEAGRAGAVALAAWHWPRHSLFTSPQDRARETALLAFPHSPATVMAGFRERDWGIHEGRPVAQAPPREATPEGGEPWPAMIARVRQALAEALDQTPRDHLPVIVAHSGVIRAARAVLGHDPNGPQAANTTPLLFRPRRGHVEQAPSHLQGWLETALDGAPY